MPRFPEEITILPEFLVRTARIWPEREAYRWYDYPTNGWVSVTWREFSERVLRWRKAFARMGLKKGDKVSMLLPSSIDALTFDQAALANGLVPVPLHASDTAGSSRYILNDSESKFLVTVSLARWHSLADAGDDLKHLERVVFTNDTDTGTTFDHISYGGLEEWLATGNDVTELPPPPAPSDLAAIVYTSGTTGRPKGVMLTHRNIVTNVRQTWNVVEATEEDVILSYLPLSHTFERTVGYYLGVASGAALVFSRGVSQLRDDLTEARPTLMSSVPRVYEQFYNHLMTVRGKMSAKKTFFFDWTREIGWRRFCRQNDLPVPKSVRGFMDNFMWGYLNRRVAAPVREFFGGRMRMMFSGGAALNQSVAQFFLGMGLPMLQAYGLTETSPVLSICRPIANHPTTVGEPVAWTEARLGENDELQVRGPQVMVGYFKREADTKAAFTDDGWFKTGDQADLSDGGRIRIKGRIKEIIVTSTGEKVPPVDLELALETDPLFAQTYVVGDDQPFISFITVLDATEWKRLAESLKLDPENPESLKSNAVKAALLKRAKAAASDFPHYALPRNVTAVLEPWTIDNGYLTPTLKLKRGPLKAHFAAEIDAMYAGHNR